MAHYLAIKTTPTEYKHFEVEKEVYIYVRQLESYIKYPQESKLKELYPERFNNEPS